jgi:hypothetical protein
MRDVKSRTSKLVVTEELRFSARLNNHAIAQHFGSLPVRHHFGLSVGYASQSGLYKMSSSFHRLVMSTKVPTYLN